MSDYESIRESLQTGDIVLFSGKGLISWVIKKLTKSQWSHIGMVLRLPEYNMVLIWESTTLSTIPDIIFKKKRRGVQLANLSDRVATYDGKIAVRLLSGRRIEMEKRAINKLRVQLRGVPYEHNYIELLLSAMKRPMLIKENLNTIFCSEQVAEAYQRAGWLPPYPPSNSYAPADFGEGFHLPLKNHVKLGREIVIKEG